MKYKVIKEFGSAKKGDVLVMDETGLVSFDITEGSSSRAMSMDCDTADDLCEKGYLLELDDTDDKISSTVEFIDNLLDTYKSNMQETNEKADKGEIQPCVKLEAETVYYNLNKVLNKIKDILINE